MGDSCMGGQLEMTMRPPGATTRWSSRRPTAGSGKNIKPNIENAAVNDASPNVSACPLPVAALTFSSAAVLRLHASTISGAKSTACTLRASGAASTVVVPGPHARSRTSSEAPISIQRIASCENGVSRRFAAWS